MDFRPFLSKPAYSLRELTDILPIGRSKIFELMRDGELKSTRVGKRIVFLAPDVADFLARLPSPEQPQKPAAGERRSPSPERPV